MILPFLALFFLLIDTCYAIFVKATLQYAVQAGVNDAITYTHSGLINEVKNTVSTQSLNLIPPGNVTVSFFAPSVSLTQPVTVGSNGVIPNQAGNIVEVDVSYNFYPLAPLFRTTGQFGYLTFSATSASVLAVFPPPSL